jgi:hypothetical protein
VPFAKILNFDAWLNFYLKKLPHHRLCPFADHFVKSGRVWAAPSAAISETIFP